MYQCDVPMYQWDNVPMNSRELVGMIILASEGKIISKLATGTAANCMGGRF